VSTQNKIVIEGDTMTGLSNEYITLDLINRALILDQRRTDITASFNEVHLDVVASAVNRLFSLEDQAVSRQDLAGLLYADIRNEYDISSALELIDTMNSYSYPISLHDKKLMEDQYKSEDAKSFAVSVMQRTLLQSLLTYCIFGVLAKVISPFIIVGGILANATFAYLSASQNSKHRPSTRQNRAESYIANEEDDLREDMAHEIDMMVEDIFERTEPHANLPIRFKRLPEAKL